jgi:hypothetical protein
LVWSGIRASFESPAKRYQLSTKAEDYLLLWARGMNPTTGKLIENLKMSVSKDREWEMVCSSERGGNFPGN